MKTEAIVCVLCGKEGGTDVYGGRMAHQECARPTEGSELHHAYASLLIKSTRELRDLCSARGVYFTFTVKEEGRRVRKFFHDTYLISRLAPMIASGAAETDTVKVEESTAAQEAKAVVVKADAKISTLGVIEARVAEIAAEVAHSVAANAVANIVKVEHYIKTDTETRRIEGRVHRQFGKLLKMCAAGCNVWLAGPAGSGKTTAAHQVAESLKRSFFFNGAIDSEYKLSGFVDAQGRIVNTAFRRAYTEGGVYLFDEVDASLAPALLAFNAALANGHADFPGSSEPVARHPDFVCIAAANTWGLGATSDYVGRNKLDAAFLDRFVSLAWDYDEDLEREISGNDDWTRKVQKYRAAARKRGLKVVISPRASINGARMLTAGMSQDEVIDATIRAKLSEQDWSNLVAEVR
jgi:cobaltochelatase CobS